MLVHLRAQDLSLIMAVQRHLQKRVRGALGPSAARVASVPRWLSDITGPRGGADLRCVVSVELLPKGTVRAEATDSDLISAVGRALARARRAIRGDGKRQRRARRPGIAVSAQGLAVPSESRRREIHG